MFDKRSIDVSGLLDPDLGNAGNWCIGNSSFHDQNPIGVL
jgi:hypothetical protein